MGRVAVVGGRVVERPKNAIAIATVSATAAARASTRRGVDEDPSAGRRAISAVTRRRFTAASSEAIMFSSPPVTRLFPHRSRGALTTLAGMTTLVITVVGDDRAGLVASIADIVDAHGGNWETSEMAELAGAFAGIVEVSVAPERADDLRGALEAAAGTLRVAVHGPAGAAQTATRSVVLTVMGNDRPGIVREITGALRTRGASIERMSTQTTDAAMAGGRLFEATVTATLAEGGELDELVEDVQRLATEIQVDVTLSE